MDRSCKGHLERVSIDVVTITRSYGSDQRTGSGDYAGRTL
jgi:hypothetical protein